MNILTKSLLGAGAAAAALVTVAAPAQAQGRYDRYDRNRDGISAGEVIAGAVILGGIAAVIASSDDDRYDNRNYNRGYNNGYYNNGYSNGNGSRRAVNQCVSTVENWASRYSRSDVTQISNIERTRNGYRVTGKLVVQDGWRGNNRGYSNDRYDRDDRYGRNDRYNGYGNQGYGRGYDKGRFTCFVERGRVVDVNYRGLEQWR
jgi:hypothetical protein